MLMRMGRSRHFNFEATLEASFEGFRSTIWSIDGEEAGRIPIVNQEHRL